MKSRVDPAAVLSGILAIILVALLAGGLATGAFGPGPGPAPSAGPSPTRAMHSPAPSPTRSATPATGAPTVSPGPSPGPTATAAPTPTATVAPTASPTRRPTPRPTPKPTPRPTASPTPAPTAAASRAVTHGSRSRPRVALTFDMGGRVGDAEAIVAWLVDHDVPATIFMTGAMAESTATDAGRDVLATVDASGGLLEIGNHTYSHPHLKTKTDAQVRDEIERAETALGRYCADDPHPYFRPPYGEYNARVLAAIGAAGYTRTVLWDDTTNDYDPVSAGGPTAAELAERIVGRARNGSIVLMHLGGYEDLEALPAIVDGLRARGLEPVSLRMLLGV